VPLTGSAARILLRGLRWVMYVVWALAGLCILFYAVLSLYLTYAEIPALDRLRGDASALNGRGDEASAQTRRDSARALQMNTVLRLKQSGHWFATTLLTVRSQNYLVGFQWRGDDRLVLILDFGCDAQLSEPVRRAGPIEILYRFDRAVILPAHGYSSFPRDRPRPPCATGYGLTR
jgi:hypothetical protein